MVLREKDMYKTIDLCAGIGGIRRGFELAKGFKTVLAAEIDDFACETYKYLFGDDPKNDLTSNEFMQKVKKVRYDILLAGFPCQSFSRAGKQEGFKDKTRGTIFFHIADIIQQTTPKAFLLENVDNLLSHDKGQTFSTIIEILENELNYKIVGVKKINGILTYSTQDFKRNTKDFGLPQNRPRVFIMGFSRKYFGNNVDMVVDNDLPISGSKKIYNDITMLLQKNVDAKFYLSQGYIDTLENHKDRHSSKGNGFGYKIINDVGIENPISSALLATGGSGKERNLILDYNENIVGLNIGSKKTPLNSRGIRVMTPDEWASLQGFKGYAFLENGKDRFAFPDDLSNAQKYKQLGNSVSIPVIEEMAKFMKKNLNKLEKNRNERQ
jgi:DNA (cytosine-5)-methyltransferase 1